MNDTTLASEERVRFIGEQGAIQDGKTIMLLQYAQRRGLKHLATRTP